MTKCIHVFCDDTATHQYLDHPVCYDCWYRQMAFYFYEKSWNMLTKEETEDFRYLVRYSQAKDGDTRNFHLRELQV